MRLPARILPLALVLLLGTGPMAGAQTSDVDPTSSASGMSLDTDTTPAISAESAGPGALLDAGDRVELAQALAEATADTDVCFGYQVQVSGKPSPPAADVLSNGGPDVPVSSSGCTKGALTLVVNLTYTCNSCESNDTARYSVTSTVPGLSGPNAKSRLERLSGLSRGALLGDDDDLALRNATAALPLLVGGATPAQPAASATAPNGDHLTGSPGSDWLRANGLGFAISLVVLLAALAVIVAGVRARRRLRPVASRRTPPRAPRPPAPSGPVSADPASPEPPSEPPASA